MVNELRAAGAQASFARYPGSHDWALWHAHVDQMLEIASNDFRARAHAAHALSTAAARRAAHQGLLAARAALTLERRQARLHDALLTVCRADTRATLATAAGQTRGMTARGLHVVEIHLIYNCELAFTAGRRSLDLVPGVLCQRLPATIGIVRHAARRRARGITARCLRLADRPAIPTPALLSSPPSAGPVLAPAGRAAQAPRRRLRRPRA
jgi:hypothetical protein